MGRFLRLGNRVTTIVPAVGTTTSKPLVAPARVRIGVEDVTNPTRLVRLIQDLQGQLNGGNLGGRSNPASAPCVVRKLLLTTGTITIIPHTLGRAYTGWLVRRVWPTGTTTNPNDVPLLPFEVLPGQSNYPKGRDQTQVLVLLPSSTNSVDLEITGD